MGEGGGLSNQNSNRQQAASKNKKVTKKNKIRRSKAKHQHNGVRIFCSEVNFCFELSKPPFLSEIVI